MFDGIYNLQLSAPDKACLDKAKDVLVQALRKLQPSVENLSLQYGTMQYGTTLGDPEFRDQLAVMLTTFNGNEVPRDTLFVTCGATHGLHIVTSTYFKSGSFVFVENPTYFPAIRIFRDDLNMNVIPVSMDEDGMVVSELEELLDKHQLSLKQCSNPVYAAMGYTVPVYHNPTTRCLSPARCKRLLQLARQHNILILCDDVYTELHYNSPATAPKKMVHLERELNNSCTEGTGHTNVISNCTFSRILAPALRLGWIEAGTEIVQKLASG